MVYQKVENKLCTGCGIKKQLNNSKTVQLLSISIARYSENCIKKFERGKKLQLSELESAILQLNKHKCHDCSITNAGKITSVSES